MRKTVALIPARGGSVGIPKKNLCLVNDRPLMDYVVQAARGSGVSEVWVSSDDDEILDYAVDAGVCWLVRPECFATNEAGLECVIEHFLDTVPNVETVVLIQPTSPLLTSQDINAGLEIFYEFGFDSVFSVAEAEDMLLWDKHTVLPVNYDPKNRGIRQNRIDRFVIETGGFYIFSTEAFKKSKCRISGKIGFCYIPFEHSFEVDKVEDLKMIEKLLKG